jgi:hypothetical protein
MRRESTQERATLVGHYEELAASGEPSASASGTAMIAFIRAFDERFPAREVWGLPSLYRLWLLAADGLALTVVGFSQQQRQRVLRGVSNAPEEAPWPHALVSGTAPDVSRALELMAVAMVRSGGW